MTTQVIEVRPAERSDLLAVVLLAEQHAQRHRQENPLLRLPRGRTEYVERLNRQRSQHRPLVAVNAQGRICGYACPDVWSLSEQSVLHAYLTAHNGIASLLTLPDPHAEDAVAVTEALLDALSRFWRDQRTTGDLVRWPSQDSWLVPVLAKHGFVLDSVCALHAFPTRAHSPTEMPRPYLIRSMQPAHVESVVALFEEELTSHVEHGLFASVTPAVLSSFRAKLLRSVERPVVLVAEEVEPPAGIVGMVVATPLHVRDEDEPGLMKPGTYGCIEHLCVRANARGQGIGRALTAFMMVALQWEQQEGYLAWYSAGNPLSARFWPHMGFVPLWSTYQRPHSAFHP